MSSKYTLGKARHKRDRRLRLSRQLPRPQQPPSSFRRMVRYPHARAFVPPFPSSRVVHACLPSERGAVCALAMSCREQREQFAHVDVRVLCSLRGNSNNSNYNINSNYNTTFRMRLVCSMLWRACTCACCRLRVHVERLMVVCTTGAHNHGQPVHSQPQFYPPQYHPTQFYPQQVGDDKARCVHSQIDLLPRHIILPPSSFAFLAPGNARR